MEQIKDFIGDVVKKLPCPFKFSAAGKIRRTLTLYFSCALNRNDCLYNELTPFTTDTCMLYKYL